MGFEGGTAVSDEEEFREVNFSQDPSHFGDSTVCGSKFHTTAMLRCTGVQYSFLTGRKTVW